MYSASPQNIILRTKYFRVLDFPTNSPQRIYLSHIQTSICSGLDNTVVKMLASFLL